MGKISIKWVRYLSIIIRYYAGIVAFTVITLDTLSVFEIPLNYLCLNLIANGSLFSCIVNYIAVRAFGYCYIQRHLIWVTFYNLLYNLLIMPTCWNEKIIVKIILLFLLLAFLMWTVIHYIYEIRNKKWTSITSVP